MYITMTALVIADSKHKLLLARARDDNTVRHLFFVLFDLPFELSDIITNYAITTKNKVEDFPLNPCIFCLG